MSDNAQNRLERARTALEGLSIGDAFGEGFFINPDIVEEAIQTRTLPDPLWRYTDDTLMSLSVLSVLRQHGAIEQDALATSFADRYEYERGYGPSMHRLLSAIREGVAWQDAAPAQFEGQGSHGNGAAMRAAPIGAYLADDPEQVIAQTVRASMVTHTHPEAVAGAIAVAIGAAIASAGGRHVETGAEFLQAVAQHIPESQVRARLVRAAGMQDASVGFAARVLGNGMQLSAQDTVPFALWCASRSLFDYEEALWLAVSALGDRDTICAIVGGIVVLSAGLESIPAMWRSAREPLPDWV